MATPRQIAANRLNAQKSTGPVSVEGKAASCMNALRHGIYAASVIPGEDPEAFASLAAEYHASLSPQGPVESGLVDTLVQAEWQQRRYRRIEAAVLNHLMDAHGDSPNALGAVYCEASPGSPIHKIAARIEAATRTWFRAHKELRALQAERRAAAEESLPPAASVPPEPHWLRSEKLGPVSAGQPPAAAVEAG
jgi:hypothetical protein